MGCSASKDVDAASDEVDALSRDVPAAAAAEEETEAVVPAIPPSPGAPLITSEKVFGRVVVVKGISKQHATCGVSPNALLDARSPRPQTHILSRRRDSDPPDGRSLAAVLKGRYTAGAATPASPLK
jgi:hypothetical protein